MESEVKLNLGSGKDYINGFVNVDIVKDFKADLYHDIATPLPYKNEEVNYIRARDILEHFDQKQIPVIFKDWVRVLSINGKMELQVPNIDVIREFRGETFLALVYGSRVFGGVDTAQYGLHKWGFNPELLRVLVESHGMEVDDMHLENTNIVCKCHKVRGSW